jgi:hypothetical protein
MLAKAMTCALLLSLAVTVTFATAATSRAMSAKGVQRALALLEKRAASVAGRRTGLAARRSQTVPTSPR